MGVKAKLNEAIKATVCCRKEANKGLSLGSE